MLFSLFLKNNFNFSWNFPFKLAQKTQQEMDFYKTGGRSGLLPPLISRSGILDKRDWFSYNPGLSENTYEREHQRVLQKKTEPIGLKMDGVFKKSEPSKGVDSFAFFKTRSSEIESMISQFLAELDLNEHLNRSRFRGVSLKKTVEAANMHFDKKINEVMRKIQAYVAQDTETLKKFTDELVSELFKFKKAFLDEQVSFSRAKLKQNGMEIIEKFVNEDGQGWGDLLQIKEGFKRELEPFLKYSGLFGDSFGFIEDLKKKVELGKSLLIERRNKLDYQRSLLEESVPLHKLMRVMNIEEEMDWKKFWEQDRKELESKYLKRNGGTDPEVARRLEEITKRASGQKAMEKLMMDPIKRTKELELSREITTHHPTKEIITAILFIAKGEKVVTGCMDGSIGITNISTESSFTYFKGHQGPIRSLVLLKTGKIASASGDCTIKIWDIFLGKCQMTIIDHQDWIWGLGNHTKSFMSTSDDATLRFWSEEDYRCEGVVKSPDSKGIRAIYVDPEQRLILIGSWQIYQIKWEVSIGQGEKVVRAWGGHDYYVRDIRMVGQNELMVSGGEDKVINTWRFSNGDLLLKTKTESEVVRMVILWDKVLVATYQNGALVFFDARNSMELINQRNLAVFSGDLQFDPYSGSLVYSSFHHLIFLN